MYGSNSRVIMTENNIQLKMRVEHCCGFLKSGRGTIKTKITYSVNYTDNSQIADENYSGVYRITRKSEALKIYKRAVKLGKFSFLVQAGT